MRKHNLYITLCLSILFLHSCEKEVLEENKTSETLNYQPESTTSVYAINIDNGVSNSCTNNILVFPNWETFKQIAKQLDDAWEQGIVNINAQMAPELTDEEIIDYFNQYGFNENQPYIDFEAQFNFCSLRADLAQKEEEWLSRRTDEENWNEVILNDPDPDNHFIWDEERPLLNAQNEVIVKNENGEDIIYKFYEAGYVEIKNNNYADLRELNKESGPTYQLNDAHFFPSEAQSNGDLNPYPYVPGDPTQPWPPVYHEPDYGYCLDRNRHVKYFEPVHGEKRIKTTVKFRGDTPFGNAKVKAKTKHYNDAWLVGWISGPSQIYAKVAAIGGLDCGQGFYPSSRTSSGYRTKVKAQWLPQDFNFDGQKEPKIVHDDVFGIHKRYDYIKTLDFYDGEVQ